MIEIQNVSVKYVREYYALLGYNAEIDGNTLLLGDNGKIVLRLLAKMDKFDGDIFYDGINLKDIRNRDLPFAYLPETPVLFKHKSVYKNLIFPLKLRKIKNADEIVENAIISHLSFLMDKTEQNKIDLNYNNQKANNQKSINFKVDNKIKDKNALLNEKIDEKIDKNAKNFNNQSIDLLKIKKLKANKLNKYEQQILCLLRAVIRAPKYLLIDNLFSTLPANYHPLAATILCEYTGTIIASENQQFDFYKDFNTLQVDN